jgi:hypothetical protein
MWDRLCRRVEWLQRHDAAAIGMVVGGVVTQGFVM